VLDFVVQAYPSFNHPAFFFMLGLFEVVVGLLLLLGKWVRLAALFIVLHLLSTLAIFVTDPGLVFETFPILTVEGEFVVKNVVLILAALLILSHLRKKK